MLILAVRVARLTVLAGRRDCVRYFMRFKDGLAPPPPEGRGGSS